MRLATVAAVFFLGTVAFASLTARIPHVMLLAVGVVSLVSFAVYAIDKSAARAGRDRVPEGMLHFIDTIGGWPGGAFAQQWLRHKSSKRSFAAGFWISVGINVAGMVLAFTGPARAVPGRLLDLLR